VLAPIVRRLPMTRDAPAGFARANAELRVRVEDVAGTPNGPGRVELPQRFATD